MRVHCGAVFGVVFVTFVVWDEIDESQISIKFNSVPYASRDTDNRVPPRVRRRPRCLSLSSRIPKYEVEFGSGERCFGIA